MLAESQRVPDQIPRLQMEGDPAPTASGQLSLRAGLAEELGLLDLQLVRPELPPRG